MEGWKPKWMIEGASLGESWMDRLWKLGLWFGLGGSLALGAFPGEMQRPNVVGVAMAKWIGWLREARHIISGALRCIRVDYEDTTVTLVTNTVHNSHSRHLKHHRAVRVLLGGARERRPRLLM